jgi:hypothetical protein
LPFTGASTCASIMAISSLWLIGASKPHSKDPNCERYDRVEIYPSDSAWGILGFTYPAKKQAIRKMDALLTSGDTPLLVRVKACGAFVELEG